MDDRVVGAYLSAVHAHAMRVAVVGREGRSLGMPLLLAAPERLVFLLDGAPGPEDTASPGRLYVLPASCDAWPAMLGEDPLDALLFSDADWAERADDPAVIALVERLSGDAYLYCIEPNPCYWKTRVGERPIPAEPSARRGRILAAWGFEPYNAQSVDDATTRYDRGEDGNTVFIGEHAFVLSHLNEFLDLMTSDAIQMAVRKGYDPIAHAQAMYRDGRCGEALGIYSTIPERFRVSSEVSADIEFGMQACCISWDLDQGSRAGFVSRQQMFMKEQRCFYQGLCFEATRPLSYVRHAELCRRLGLDYLGDSYLRTARAVCGPDACDGLLQTAADPIPWPTVRIECPVWKGQAQSLRVLLITMGRPNYGLDTLYDGLCSILGDEHVVEFPYKRTLHGGASPFFSSYPCFVNRRGESHSVHAIVEQLQAGHFDLVLYGDTEGLLPPEFAKVVGLTAGRTPLFALDQQDDLTNTLPPLLERLGRRAVSGYFKRELVHGMDYGDRALPLPFSYLDSLVPAMGDAERAQPLFWAGQLNTSLRNLYVTIAERLTGDDLRRKYTQAEYRAALLDSRMGLNAYGFGFDTVRYWELPAHGCLLFSERLPIVVPHDFEDGKTAVFFSDVAEFETKLAYYLGHPDAVRQIARAGHEHFLTYHTSSARARQLLGWAALLDPKLRSRP